MHGVPVSLKDQYNVVGFDSAIGFTHGVGQPATEDAALVIAVREAGGVPFCKTNVPQTMLSFECANPLGVTKNPHSAERTPGGSTGGEAALLGADGSALGFGSDSESFSLTALERVLMLLCSWWITSHSRGVQWMLRPQGAFRSLHSRSAADSKINRSRAMVE